MALVLLVCAGLMMRSFAVLLNTQPGFSTPEHLETMRVAILPSIASGPVAVTRAQNEIADKLAQLPGVSSVGYAADVPMDGLEPNWNSIFVQGRDPWGAKSTLPMRLFNYTSPNYFHSNSPCHVLLLLLTRRRLLQPRNGCERPAWRCSPPPPMARPKQPAVAKGVDLQNVLGVNRHQRGRPPKRTANMSSVIAGDHFRAPDEGDSFHQLRGRSAGAGSPAAAFARSCL